jgi:hypothetical protein
MAREHTAEELERRGEEFVVQAKAAFESRCAGMRERAAVRTPSASAGAI